MLSRFRSRALLFNGFRRVGVKPVSNILKLSSPTLLTSIVKLSQPLGLFSLRQNRHYVVQTEANKFSSLNLAGYTVSIFDLGGTLALKGCWHPFIALKKMCQYFASPAVELTDEEIRKPMGDKKGAHIAELFKLIQEKMLQLEIEKRIELEPIEKWYPCFEKILHELLENPDVVPHAKEALMNLINQKIKVCVTSGFHDKTTQMLRGKLKDQLPIGNCPMISADQVKDGSRASMVLQSLIESKLLPENFEKLDKKIQQALINNACKKTFFVTDAPRDVMSVKANFPDLLVVCVIDFGIRRRMDLPLSEAREIARQEYEAAGADIVIENLSQLESAILAYKMALAAENKYYMS